MRVQTILCPCAFLSAQVVHFRFKRYLLCYIKTVKVFSILLKGIVSHNWNGLKQQERYNLEGVSRILKIFYQLKEWRFYYDGKKSQYFEQKNGGSKVISLRLIYYSGSKCQTVTNGLNFQVGSSVNVGGRTIYPL